MPGRARAALRSRGKFSVVVSDDFFRGGVQIAGAAVVAEAGPEFQDFGLRSACERFDFWEMVEETLVIGHYRGDASLLEHYFGDPDAVGVAARAPGEIALVGAEPF